MLAQRTWKYRLRTAIRGTAGEANFDRLDAWRRWRHYRRAGVVFIHVPKAAGSTVANCLYGKRLGHHRAIDLMHERPEEWRRLQKVAVLREPVERLLSAYTFVFAQGTEEGAVRWRPEYNEPKMQDLDYFVQSYLGTQDLRGADPVFHPQAWYVGDDDTIVHADVECYPVHQLQHLLDSVPAPRQRRLITRSNAQPHRYRPTMSSDSRKVVDRVYAADFALWRRYGHTGAGNGSD